jgi:hypothetical protein
MSFVWSWSAIECFENCPRTFYHKYILREKEPPSEALIKGRATHVACEAYIKGETAELDPKFLPLLESVRKHAGGKKSFTELQMGITKNFEPCGFFDKSPDLFGRSAADVLIIDYPNAFLGDWKTGKVREKSDQIMLMTLFIFLHFPRVHKVTGVNLWLEAGKMGEPYTYTRDMMPGMWLNFLPRIMRIYDAIEKNNFPLKPSGLCGWCSVLTCQHNRK